MRWQRAVLVAGLVGVFSGVAQAQTYPAQDADWTILTQYDPDSMTFVPVTDPEGDTPGSRDIVGDVTNPMGFIAADATHFYFRLRIDESVLQNATNLSPFGWGCVIDTDLDTAGYELLSFVNGVTNPDTVSLSANDPATATGEIDDPADTILVTYSDPLLSTSDDFGYAREAPAPTIFPIGDPDEDVFLDWAIERSVLEAAGVTPLTPLRFACGTAPQGSTLGSDSAGSTDLDDVLGGPVLCGPTGCVPQDCAGFGDACTGGQGICAFSGVNVCINDVAVCNAEPGDPLPNELCNGVDDDCDGNTDEGCADTDGDGLVDGEEGLYGTDPNDADTDDDGVPDGQEPGLATDDDGDGLLGGLDADSDNDGLFDGTELGLDCDDPATDASAAQCIEDADASTTTDPLDADTDGGGVSDGNEDFDLDGAIDQGETDPNDPDDDVTPVDTDGDGLSDDLEDAIGTDPDDADSDDDGVPDGLEPGPTTDPDGDGLITALDPDSDDDGIFDGTELGFDCLGADIDLSQNTCIPDADDSTTTSPLDADTDDGGVSDGDEDLNHDGAIDPGETDPNDPTDDPCTTDSDCGDLDSGKVCDTTNSVCIDGCRGNDGGNGCPLGEYCTSQDSTIGECLPDVGQGGAGGGGGAGGAGGGGEGAAGPATTTGAGAGTTTSGAGGAGGAADPDGIAITGGGCSCSTGGDAGGDGFWIALAAVGVVGMRRRRR